MAERVGFEPTIPVKVCPLSRRIVSTTHAPLRVGQECSVETLLATSCCRQRRSKLRLYDNSTAVTDGFERTSAALPRCARPALRCEPRSYGSVADDSGLASLTSRPRLWGHPSHTPGAESGHAPSRRRTWRTAQL